MREAKTKGEEKKGSEEGKDRRRGKEREGRIGTGKGRGKLLKKGRERIEREIELKEKSQKRRMKEGRLSEEEERE